MAAQASSNKEQALRVHKDLPGKESMQEGVSESHGLPERGKLTNSLSEASPPPAQSVK